MREVLRNSFLSSQQDQRLSPPVAGYIDLHCHCLPGIDDGPATLDGALALCRALCADGVSTVIATPHQLGRYEGRNRASDVREAVAALRNALEASGIPLSIEPGAEVRLDGSITQLLERDQILTLADGMSDLLLELPRDTYIDPLPIIERMAARGVRVLISHPERYPIVDRRPDLVRTWLDHGAGVVLTAGSLAGDFGSAASRIAWELISADESIFVATDAHDVSRRPPRMSVAFALIEQRLGHAAARSLCIDNPHRILRRRKVDAAIRIHQREDRHAN